MSKSQKKLLNDYQTIDSEITIQRMIHDSCRRFADTRAIGFVDEEEITYRQLGERVEDLTRFIQDRGIGHGDKVAIIGENSPNWVIAYLAVTTLGAVAVPILPEFRAAEILHIIRHSGARALFVSDRYFHKIEDLDFSAFDFVSLLDTFSITESNMPKAVMKRLIAEGSRELRRISHNALRLVGLEPSQLKPSDMAAIIYTSGTTGHSKGVMLTQHNIAGNAVAGSFVQKLGPSDRLLSILPLAHVYECTLGMLLPLLSGSSVYYLRKPPTAAVLLPALLKVRPTAILTVPLIMEKIYKSQVLPKIRGAWLLRVLSNFSGPRRKIHRLAGRKLMKMFGGELVFFRYRRI